MCPQNLAPLETRLQSHQGDDYLARDRRGGLNLLKGQPHQILTPQCDKAIHVMIGDKTARPALDKCVMGASTPASRRNVSKKARAKPAFDLDFVLARAGPGRAVSKFLHSQVVYSQGETADSVFYVMEGKVKIAVVSARGKEAVIAVHAHEDFFGEGCLIGQPLRLATASAMTETAVMRFDKAAILGLLNDVQQFSATFMRYVLTRNARVEEDLVDQLFNSSEKRLARLLLLMANFGKEGKQETVIAKISQETLAEMVGTTRSRINVFMNKFRELGFIEYGNQLKVHSSLLNVVLGD